MAKLDVRSKDGKKVGTVELSDKIAKAKSSNVALHRAVVAEEANSRQGTSKSKTRSETRGGGRKPYRQKKTGRARQGTIRAPHYAHGGMAFALEPRDYEKKLNKKERRAAILGALAARVDEGAVIIADKIVFGEPKTNLARKLLDAFDLGKVDRVLIILSEYDKTAHLSFRNIPSVTVRTAPAKSKEKGEATKTEAVSARDLLVAHKIVIAQEALERIEEVWGK